MRPEKKGQLIGGAIGMLIGAVMAYVFWGFKSPGGIVILVGFSFGGLAGWRIGLKKSEPGNSREAHH